MKKHDQLGDFVTSDAGTRVRHGCLRVLALAGIATAFLATGCDMRGTVCRSEEYPVLHVGDHGAACQTKGKEPPPGYVRYPEGKVPKHPDDEWDRYWRTHIVDSNGNIVHDDSAEARTAQPS
jgi:hypothetical protein